MPASAFTPDVVVEIGFGSGYSTPLASVSWTDVSAYVEAQQQISITRGRQDEFGDVSPSQLRLTLDNRDGRFTPGYSSGAYYPNVRLGTPIRVSATWPLSGSPVTYRRFTGYVGEWPVEWPDQTSGLSHVTVTASSRTARLGRSAALSNVVSQEILTDSPVLYYPLGEPAGAVQASNVSAEPQYPLTIGQTGEGGAVTFGSGSGPGTDGLTAAVFAPATTSDGKWLGGEIQTSPINAGGELTIECWIVASANTTGIVHLISQDGAASVRLAVSGATARGSLVQPSASLPSLVGPTSVVFNGLHHVVYRVSLDGVGGYAQSLFVDGQVDDSGSGATSLTALADVDFVYVAKGNPTPFPTTVFDGTIAHVAVYDSALSDARVAEHYASGTTGFVGESSDERVARIAAWVGVPTAEISAEPGNTQSMAFQDTAGAAPLSALLDVTHTEDGLLFDAGTGTLTFHARGHRYTTASSLTLSATTQQIESDLQPKLDDFGLLNDVTVATPTYSVHVVDSTSKAAHGEYNATVTLLTTSDLEADDAANYKVAAYADPLVRVAGATVQVIAQPPADITAILAVELGDRVTLAGLPSQAPASSTDFFVEGISETIGSEGQGWLWTANLSPVLGTQSPWRLGTSQLGATTVLGY